MPKNPTKTLLPQSTKTINSSMRSHDTMSGFLYTWEWSHHEADFGLFPFSSPYPLFSHILPQPLCTVNPFIHDHATPKQTPVKPFPKHPFISLNCIPILLLIWISVFFPWHRLCVCAACFIPFSCQNVTKTALAALWMQPPAKTDVMIILTDTDYPYKVFTDCPYSALRSMFYECDWMVSEVCHPWKCISFPLE